MTTPSKAEQKRPQAFEVKSDGYFDTYEAYDKSEADAIFESLEAELTREKERSARLRELLKRAHSRMVRADYKEPHFLNEIMKGVEL